MEDSTPKERYDARKELKRIARDPNEKRDEEVSAEYAFDLAERMVTAFERFVFTYSRKSN